MSPATAASIPMPSPNSLGDGGCLIIGGGGYIGSFLIPLLLAKGRRVTVLGRQPKPSYVLPRETTYVQGSYSDSKLLATLVADHTEVIQLAYGSVPNTSFDNPLNDLIQNLPPMVNLFSEIARRNGKLVLVSSGGTVYGEATTLPIPESHNTRPVSPYGVTKLTLEKYAHLYAATHGLKVICVRPSNAYGEGQKPFTGQGFIATLIASGLKGKPIVIYGDRGTIRDYIHVTDVANGIAAALAFGLPNDTFNISSGVGYSNVDILDLVGPMLGRIGCSLQVSHKVERPFDVKINVLDSSALRNRTGWRPLIEIEQGLWSTCEWMEKIYR